MAPSPFKSPPSDPSEYVAQIGRKFWRTWEWHTAPAAVSPKASEVSIADYSVDLATKMKFAVMRQAGITQQSKFDDKVGWSDVAFASLESLTEFHGGSITLKEAMSRIREYLSIVLDRREILLCPDHPNYRSQDARSVEELRAWALSHLDVMGATGQPLPASPVEQEANGMATVDWSKMKVLLASKKYGEFAKWLLADDDRVPSILRSAQPLLVDPPKSSVQPHMFGFRRHISSILRREELTPDMRQELADKVINQWGKMPEQQLRRTPHDVYKQLGIPNVFDANDEHLDSALGRLKKLAPNCKGLLPQIEAVCMQMILRLSGEGEHTERQKNTLVNTGNFWRTYLRDNDRPLYEHQEFGLAYLAGVLRLSDKEDILKYIGAFEEK